MKTNKICRIFIRWYSSAILVVLLLLASVCSGAVNKNYNYLSDNHLTEYPKDLRTLSEYDRRIFFNSFTTVITDIDDTLWQNGSPIKGAIENIKKLRDCGKKILFLTNNSVYPKKKLIKILQAMTYNVSSNEIINPSDTLTWYLKNIKFNSTAFVIGTTNFINTLEKNGIQLLTGPEKLLENPKIVIEALTHLDEKVKAVIFEFDINVNYAKIMQAAEYLKREDVIFLSGTSDRQLPMTKSLSLIGTAPFIDILGEYTGRTSTGYAKPSRILKDYLTQVHVRRDPEKTLFIGNSLKTDMKFAEVCGFQKLWVRSGVNASMWDNKYVGMPYYHLPDLGQMPQCVL